MEQWTIKKYAEPFLNVKDVRVESSDSPYLLLDTAQGELELTIDGSTQSLEDIAVWLGQLRSPDSEAWASVYRGQVSDAERKILLEADNLSLIEERHIDDDFSSRAADLDDIESDISIYASLIGRLLRDGKLSTGSLEFLRNIYHGYLLQCMNFDNKKLAASRCQDNKDSNFYGVVVQRQARYLSRHCPLALAACAKMLDLAAAISPDKVQEYWSQSLEYWFSGIYNTKDIQQYLDATFHIASQFDKESAARLYSLPAQVDAYGQSGTNFMVKAEKIAIEALGSFGTPALLRLVRENKEVPSFLRLGFFLEEYHVTKRFVEMITPMLAHRLNPTIRARMYQYFAEEVGHEVYERKTCLALGISERDLASAFPLPLYTAYVDLFTDLAETNPLGFIASIMITEGMLGGSSPVLDALSKPFDGDENYHEVAREHDSLNTELNHSSLSRLFMREVPFISEAAQQEALSNMVLILELNHRALEWMFEFYKNSNALIYKGVASQSL